MSTRQTPSLGLSPNLKAKRRLRIWGVRAWWVVFALILVGFAIVWQPDRPVAELEKRWAAAPSQWVSLAVAATASSPATSIRVHVRDTGPQNDPEPIVLVHGTSSSLHTWDVWASELEQTRRVVRLDLPGYGLTGPYSDHDYAMGRYGATLSALADALALPPSVFVGNSLGAMVAWEHALSAPSRVSKLVLIDAAGYPMTSSSVPLGFKVAQMPVLKHVIGLVLPRSMIEASLKNVYGDPSKVSEPLVQRYFELTLREGNRQAVIKSFEQNRAATPVGSDPQGVSARVRQIKQPTAIVWGALDRLIPLDHAQRFKADLPKAQLSILDGLGHVPMEEDPMRSLAAVRGFLGVKK